jgi:hypothetical protein
MQTTKKTIQVTTKGNADRMHVDSLFNPVNGKTLVKMRFDMGKYKAAASFVGRDVEVSENVVAVWSEAKRDQDGPYRALYCLKSA